MKKIFLFTLACTLAYGCNPEFNTSQTSAPAQIKTGSIVGGSVVDPLKTDAGFVVHFNGGCGGSIIGAKWILTAAHCKVIFKQGLSGGNLDMTSTKRITLKMKQYYIHPGHTSTDEAESHDFALIELATPINFATTPSLKPIALADEAFAAAGGIDEDVISTVYGWGTTTESGRQSKMLREVSIPLVSRERANSPDSYGGNIDESMLAAGLEQGGKDSCQGDSGGPLVVPDKATGKVRLAGVVSFGDGCARPKLYGIYSNVAFAHDWIVKTMAEHP